MRILHVVPTYIPAWRYGGPIYSVHNLCKSMVNRGHEVHVFTTNVDGSEDSDVLLETPVDLDGVNVWYFPSKRMRRLYWSPPMSRALITQLKSFDLVHLHSIYNWPPWIAARLARKFGTPYIQSPRGMLMKDAIGGKSTLIKKIWLSLIEQKNIEQAAALHVTSSLESKELTLLNYNLPRVCNVPNGMDLQAPDAQTSVSQELKALKGKGPFLLFLSRISWKKGLDRLIPAMKYVEGAHLVIAGPDEANYQSEMERLTEKLGLSKKITFLGPIYGADKDYLLREAAAMVLPSYSENFGNVVPEAMAASCPVVVTPEVGASELVLKYGGGLVVDGAPETFGNALQQLLSNPMQMAEMGTAGRKAVAEYLTWASVAEQMEAVYGEIVKDMREVNS